MKRGLLAVLLVIVAGASSGCCCTRNYLCCARHRVGSCLNNCWYAGWNWCDRGRWDRCGYGDRGYGDRGCGDRGYGDRGYGDRGYGDRGYGDRGCGDRGYGDRGYGDCCRRDVDGYGHDGGHACHRRGCGDYYPTDLFVGNGCDPCDRQGQWLGRGRPREPWTASAPPRGQWAADYDDEGPPYRVNEARVVNSHARGEAPSTLRR